MKNTGAKNIPTPKPRRRFPAAAPRPVEPRALHDFLVLNQHPAFTGQPAASVAAAPLNPCPAGN